MGLDGGTIVTRSDVLRGQSWRVAKADNSHSSRGGTAANVNTEQGVEKAVERAVAWSTCALSSQPLREPVVACGLGRLYNKEAVLQFLLCKRGKVTAPELLLQYANQLRVAAGALDHIAALSDLLTVHLTPSHAAGAPPSTSAAAAAAAAGVGAAAAATAGVASSSSAAADGTAAAAAAAAATSSRRGGGGGGGGGSGGGGGYVCPVTLLPCERHPCSALRPCGHVLSDRALANLGGDASCPVCAVPYTAVLPINGTAEQAGVLRQQLRAAAAAAAGGSKGTGKGGDGGGKRKRKAAEVEAVAGAEGVPDAVPVGGEASQALGAGGAGGGREVGVGAVGPR